MKQIFSIFVSLCLAVAQCTAIDALSTHKALTIPCAIQELLDGHTLELQDLLKEWNSRPDARMGWNVCTKEWLPGYYLKYGIERVAHAQKIKDLIETHALCMLAVPDKYIYHVPGLSSEVSNETCIVVARAATGKNGKGQCIGLEQVKQLCKLAELAHHYDLHPANLVTTLDGKIMIIDTDKQAMPSSDKIAELEQDWLLCGNRIHTSNGICMMPEIINDPLVKLELAMYSKHKNYSDEAYAYLIALFKTRERERLKAYEQAQAKS